MSQEFEIVYKHYEARNYVDAQLNHNNYEKFKINLRWCPGNYLLESDPALEKDKLINFDLANLEIEVESFNGETRVAVSFIPTIPLSIKVLSRTNLAELMRQVKDLSKIPHAFISSNFSKTMIKKEINKKIYGEIENLITKQIS